MSSAAVSTPQHQQQQSPRYSSTYQSASPPSRRPGGSSSGYASQQNTQQQQYASPSASAGMSTPRAQQYPQTSYGSDTMNSSTYQQFYPDQPANGPVTALPIRTSSQQAPTSAAAAPYDSRGYPRDSSGYASGNERERASDNERRQRSQKSPQADPGCASRSSRSRNAASAPQHSRSATAVGQTPMDTSLPRENSAIIKHIVVDDPQTDVARERARVAEAQPHQSGMEPGMVDQSTPSGDSQRKHRSRQEHLRQSTQRKEVKFGDYILGQTLGEGEFGKVKMGWKKDSTVQVAIKLIRKESLQSNSSRLPKIYREIAILRELQHPNIVRLHEFVETERHMGIILEYASGGELFDYILNHRYLKDPQARRLFAQLVSGVGYLHKKGIVHRDLKLENLLLDRNRNIIITDFGFANTFNPHDELSEEVTERISDKEFVKREGLGEVDQKSGFRRGDLMQTSCGSPCYAAPELVVSDGLYTGRKVDVWSCGVILYAMLAGYLPFDDDPANPEGDNINLLYKYIVSTPLTFPEYVSPHARDLLRRILVPDPKLRADLFEVARHSWLSEYSHVVGFIGSSTKSDRDIAKSAVQQGDDPLLSRSASVREPASRSPAAMSAGGVPKQAPIVGDATAGNAQRDAKRRTVQLEYVAPKDSTSRGETSPTAVAAPPVSGGRTRARGDVSGPTEVTPSTKNTVPRKEVGSSNMPPPTRPARDQTRATSDSTGFMSNQTPAVSRPNTQGTLGSARLPSRGNSYSQPAAASPTTATAQGHFSQPKSNAGYIISGPGDQTSDNRPISQQNLAQYQQQRLQQQEQQTPSQRGHKRSSTLGSIGDRIMGRSNSRRASQQQEKPATLEKRDRKYPPVSMRTAIPNDAQEAQPRTSTESSRRTSFGFNRKDSEAPSESNKRSSRRFSFLPGSGSMSNLFGGKKDQSYESSNGQYYPNTARADGRPESKGMAFGRGASRSPSMSTTNSTIPMYYDPDRETTRNQRRSNAPPQSQSQGQAQTQRSPATYEKALPPQPQQQPQQQQGSYGATSPPPVARKQFRDDGYGGNLLDPSRTPQPGQGQGQQEPVERYWTPSETLDQVQSAQSGYGGGNGNEVGQYGAQQQREVSDGYGYGAQEDLYEDRVGGGAGAGGMSGVGGGQGQMRQPQRKFAHEYEGGHAGSSSATRRVMDFFRRRGKDRVEG